jgi:hypothetical protein
VNSGFFPGKQILPRLELAWNEACDATVRNLEAKVVKKREDAASRAAGFSGVGPERVNGGFERRIWSGF